MSVQTKDTSPFVTSRAPFIWRNTYKCSFQTVGLKHLNHLEITEVQRSSVIENYWSKHLHLIDWIIDHRPRGSPLSLQRFFLGLDVMKRDISVTTRCRHYYVLLCIMYGTLHPGVRTGMLAVVQGHGRLYSVCWCSMCVWDLQNIGSFSLIYWHVSRISCLNLFRIGFEEVFLL